MTVENKRILTELFLKHLLTYKVPTDIDSVFDSKLHTWALQVNREPYTNNLLDIYLRKPQGNNIFSPTEHYHFDCVSWLFKPSPGTGLRLMDLIILDYEINKISLLSLTFHLEQSFEFLTGGITKNPSIFITTKSKKYG